MTVVASIPTENYREVIEVSVPVRFYWDEVGFDGIEFGPYERDLFEWEEEMIDKCLDAITVGRSEEA